MQIELHRNNVYQGVELLLLVPMLFLRAIPKVQPAFLISLYTDHRSQIHVQKS